LDKQLASIPKGCWTIVCAHHPLFSNGLHGDNGVLQTQWGALFKKYNLSFYVCGHDHDLQHLEIPDWRTSFVLAGGGGAGTRTMRNDTRGPFSRAVHGFAHFQFKGDLATVSMVGEDGNILHAFTRTRDGVVKTVETTGSDRATSKPLKAIQGLEEKAN